MKKIVDGKLYDTDTAELLLTIRSFSVTRLYLTKKGAFFLTTTFAGIEPVPRWKAQELIVEYGSVELYTRMYGAPEEA